MEVIKELPSTDEYRHSIITIGFYDGVHRGHQKVIGEMVKQARAKGVKSCVITFTPHPCEIFSHKPFPLLTTWEEKREIFQKLGVDLTIVLPFTRKLASLSPLSFIEMLNKHLQMDQIIVGEDFVFGKERRGDTSWLKKQENRFGYKLKVIPLLKTEKGKVSSSLIRDYLKKGKVREAAKCLGRPPTILGKVVRGKGRGRLIGYPTANLKPHPCKLLPCSGVYAGRVTLEDGSYDSIINVGSSPTFGESLSRVEAHIINFEGDLYDREVRIELMERIREIRKFSSPTLLTKRLEKDKQIAEKILSGRKNDA